VASRGGVPPSSVTNLKNRRKSLRSGAARKRNLSAGTTVAQWCMGRVLRLLSEMESLKL